jgi:hypothetical protein
MNTPRRDGEPKIVAAEDGEVATVRLGGDFLICFLGRVVEIFGLNSRFGAVLDEDSRFFALGSLLPTEHLFIKEHWLPGLAGQKLLSHRAGAEAVMKDPGNRKSIKGYAAVESHPCAQNAQEWGTRQCCRSAYIAGRVTESTD